MPPRASTQTEALRSGLAGQFSSKAQKVERRAISSRVSSGKDDLLLPAKAFDLAHTWIRLHDAQSARRSKPPERPSLLKQRLRGWATQQNMSQSSDAPATDIIGLFRTFLNNLPSPFFLGILLWRPILAFVRVKSIHGPAPEWIVRGIVVPILAIPEANIRCKDHPMSTVYYWQQSGRRTSARLTFARPRCECPLTIHQPDPQRRTACWRRATNAARGIWPTPRD